MDLAFCATCQYFQNKRNDPERGECHKNAPVVVQTHEYNVRVVWPLVRDDDWCGEYRAGTPRPSKT